MASRDMKKFKYYAMAFVAGGTILAKSLLVESKAVLVNVARDSKVLVHDAKILSATPEVLSAEGRSASHALTIPKTEKLLSKIEKVFDGLDLAMNVDLTESANRKTIDEVLMPANKAALVQEFNEAYSPKKVEWAEIVDCIEGNPGSALSLRPDFKRRIFFKYSNSYFQSACYQLLGSAKCDADLAKELKEIAQLRGVPSDTMIYRIPMQRDSRTDTIRK